MILSLETLKPIVGKYYKRTGAHQQRHSQDYIKGVSEFRRSLLSTDTDSLTDKTLGHQR